MVVAGLHMVGCVAYFASQVFGNQMRGGFQARYRAPMLSGEKLRIIVEEDGTFRVLNSKGNLAIDGRLLVVAPDTASKL